MVYSASSDGTISCTDLETGLSSSPMNLNPGGWQVSFFSKHFFLAYFITYVALTSWLHGCTQGNSGMLYLWIISGDTLPIMISSFPGPSLPVVLCCKIIIVFMIVVALFFGGGARIGKLGLYWYLWERSESQNNPGWIFGFNWKDL